MKIRLTLIICMLLANIPLFAQAPTNDNCSTATEITTPENWCRADLTNVNATASIYAAPVCSDKDQGDVWFTFKAAFTQTKVVVTGKGMKRPMIALYNSPTDKCGNLLFENVCSLDFDGDNKTELVATGLKINDRIYVRVYGEDGSKGNFDICVSSYGIVVDAAKAYSDCSNGFELCDKTSIAFKTNGNQGANSKEGDTISCFNSLKKERMSQWLKFRCQNAGKLTFTITPNDITKDDIDFVVFKLLNGKNSCGQKQTKILRCMGGTAIAPGGFGNGGFCTGGTGLSESEFDTAASSDCPFGVNNFLSALDMEAGEWYSIFINTTIINNLSATNSGSGFTIDFGGSGTFSCNQGVNPTSEVADPILNLKVFPSPSSQTNVRVEGVLASQSESKIPFRVINQVGQIVFQSEILPDGELIDTSIELPQNLVSGLYLLDFQVNTNHIFRKWVLAR